MIILSGDQVRRKHDSFNGSTLRLPERVVRRRRSWSPLPDYEASEAQYRRSLGLDAQKLPPPQAKIWKIALFGLLIYALLTTAIGVPIIVRKSKGNSQESLSLNDPNMLGNQQPSSSGMITLGHNMLCNTWNDTSVVDAARPYTTTLQTQLAAMGDISIRSNATLELTQQAQVNGSLTVEYDSNASKDVQFVVTLQTTAPSLQNSTLICHTDAGTDRGLSIFFPDNMNETDSIYIDIHVKLSNTANAPRTISNLNTYLPMFSQTFGDLRKFKFGAVSIEGTAQPISLMNIQAPRISVKNMLGSISGTFNSSEVLILDTIKGAINASITLVKPPGRSNPTSLTLDTGNDEIDARVTLLSPSKLPTSSPHFVGKIFTFNGPINLNISHHQLTSPIPTYFSAQTNLAELKVRMDQKFQGAFVAQTKMENVAIQHGDENPNFDPTGAHKPRVLKFDQETSSRASGWIGWGNRPASGAGQGYLDIASALGPVELYFGP